MFFSQVDSKLPKGTAYFTSGPSSSNSNKIYLRDMPSYVSSVMSDSGLKFAEEYKVDGVLHLCTTVQGLTNFGSEFLYALVILNTIDQELDA